jgi:hypothetical protein
VLCSFGLPERTDVIIALVTLLLAFHRSRSLKRLDDFPWMDTPEKRAAQQEKGAAGKIPGGARTGGGRDGGQLTRRRIRQRPNAVRTTLSAR